MREAIKIRVQRLDVYTEVVQLLKDARLLVRWDSPTTHVQDVEIAASLCREIVAVDWHLGPILNREDTRLGRHPRAHIEREHKPDARYDKVESAATAVGSTQLVTKDIHIVSNFRLAGKRPDRAIATPVTIALTGPVETDKWVGAPIEKPSGQAVMPPKKQSFPVGQRSIEVAVRATLKTMKPVPFSLKLVAADPTDAR